MKSNEELLQRCFDGDLNDDEMRTLFAEMSKSEDLRIQYRALQTLRNGLHSMPIPDVPATLDERIRSLVPKTQIIMLPSKSAFRRVITKKYALSMPAFAATILLLLAGSYFAASRIQTPKAETEIVYIMQLPQVEVHAVFN